MIFERLSQAYASSPDLTVVQIVEISAGTNTGKTFIDKKFSMFGNKPAAALQE
jgi:hypothetical protein